MDLAAAAAAAGLLSAKLWKQNDKCRWRYGLSALPLSIPAGLTCSNVQCNGRLLRPCAGRLSLEEAESDEKNKTNLVTKVDQGPYHSTAARLESDGLNVKARVGLTRSKDCSCYRVVVCRPSHPHTHTLKHDAVQSHRILRSPQLQHNVSRMRRPE